MAALDSRINDLASAVAGALKTQRGFSSFCAGKPAASEVIGAGTAPYTFTAAPARCVATAGAGATASATFVIKAGATQIGTVIFSAGSTAGVFSFTTAVITAGTQISIVAPATADATLADISFLVRP